jgi:hypothetical protein
MTPALATGSGEKKTGDPKAARFLNPAETGGRLLLRSYLTTLIVLVTVFVPALFEVTLNRARILPTDRGLTRTLTVRLAPGLTLPTWAPIEMPRPEAFSLTPVATVVPVFRIVTR